jgi:hypothetical protein
MTPSLTLDTLSDSCRRSRRWSDFSLRRRLLVDKLSGMLPFLALGALGIANLVAAVGAPQGARRAEELGEGAL